MKLLGVIQFGIGERAICDTCFDPAYVPQSLIAVSALIQWRWLHEHTSKSTLR